MNKTGENIEKKAMQGDVQAQYILALRYAKGISVRKNLTIASKWFEKWAEVGGTTAKSLIAEMYRLGLRVERNKTKAGYWYDKYLEEKGEITMGDAARIRFMYNRDARKEEWIDRIKEDGDIFTKLYACSFIPQFRKDLSKWDRKTKERFIDEIDPERKKEKKIIELLSNIQLEDKNYRIRNGWQKEASKIYPMLNDNYLMALYYGGSINCFGNNDALYEHINGIFENYKHDAQFIHKRYGSTKHDFMENALKTWEIIELLISTVKGNKYAIIKLANNSIRKKQIILELEYGHVQSRSEYNNKYNNTACGFSFNVYPFGYFIFLKNAAFNFQYEYGYVTKTTICGDPLGARKWGSDNYKTVSEKIRIDERAYRLKTNERNIEWDEITNFDIDHYFIPYWLVISAKEGSEDAFTKLAECFLIWKEQIQEYNFFKTAIEVPEFKEKLIEKIEAFNEIIWKKQFRNNDIDFSYKISQLFYNGEIVNKDNEKYIYWLTRSAIEGENPKAQYALAKIYKKGEIVNKDEKEELCWLKLSAKNGIINAKNRLAELYAKRDGGGNVKKIVNLLLGGAKKGNAKAQLNLARIYAKGDGIEQDKLEAAKWYNKWAQQGTAEDKRELANMYAIGYEVAQDKQEAAKWYNKWAQQGTAEEKHKLAKMYVKGDGVEQDSQEAAKWFNKWAEEKTTEEQLELAKMYAIGYEVAQDKQEAAKWFSKWAEKGTAKDQYELAKRYEEGNGVPKNKELALKWLIESAKRGHEIAWMKYGNVLFNGENVLTNKKKAAYWYEKAAEQGNIKAQKLMGELYFKGEGVIVNMEKAIYWYEMWASNRNGEDQFNLGVMFYNGDNIQKNKTKAAIWIESAYKKGYKGAKDFWDENNLWNYLQDD